MKCLRCSYCCIAYDVIVPISKTKCAYKPHNQRCWNLEFNSDGATCKIHQEKFYERSPCDSHTQIESRGTDCRMGVYCLGEGGKVLEPYKNMGVAVPDIKEIPNGKSKKDFNGNGVV